MAYKSKREEQASVLRIIFATELVSKSNSDNSYFSAKDFELRYLVLSGGDFELRYLVLSGGDFELRYLLISGGDFP